MRKDEIPSLSVGRCFLTRLHLMICTPSPSAAGTVELLKQRLADPDIKYVIFAGQGGTAAGTGAIAIVSQTKPILR